MVALAIAGWLIMVSVFTCRIIPMGSETDITAGLADDSFYLILETSINNNK